MKHFALCLALVFTTGTAARAGVERGAILRDHMIKNIKICLACSGSGWCVYRPDGFGFCRFCHRPGTRHVGLDFTCPVCNGKGGWR